MIYFFNNRYLYNVPFNFRSEQSDYKFYNYVCVCVFYSYKNTSIYNIEGGLINLFNEFKISIVLKLLCN